MVQVTIALEEKVLETAERKARQQGTSVDELLRRYLESYTDLAPKSEQQEAIRSLLDLSSKVKSGSGGRRWTRDELHER